MAADASGAASGDLEAVERRLGELSRKLDEVRQAQSSAKTTARLITVVIVVVALAGVTMLIMPIWSAYQNREQYAEAMQAEFSERIAPMLQEEVQASLQDIGPEIRTAVQEKIDERREDLVAAVDLNTMLLFDNLQQFAETSLADAAVEIEISVRNGLTDLLPQIDDPAQRDLIIGNFATALEEASKELVEEKLDRHVTSLANIETQMRLIETPQVVAEMNDVELGEEMNRVLSEFGLLALQRSLTPETREALADLASEE